MNSSNLVKIAKAHGNLLWSKLKTPRGREIAFTLTGTAILLLTFYIHEVKREQAKDLADALERAEGVLVLRADIQRLSAPPKDATNPHPFSDDIILSLNLDRYLADVEFITKFFGEKEKKAFANAIDADRKALESLDKLKQALIEEDTALEQTSEAGVLRLDLEKSYQETTRNFETTAKEVIELVAGEYKRVSKEADEKASQSEDDYRWFNKFSYVLYPLGFVFNMVGKLYGLGEIKAE